jgi:hypothetical protein
MPIEEQQPILRPTLRREEQQRQLIGRQQLLLVQHPDDLAVTLGQMPPARTPAPRSPAPAAPHAQTTKNYESTLLCRGFPSARSGATARLPAPIRRLGDAAGSAADNAIRTATGNASPFPSRLQQQISKQRHRLAALLLAQPHTTRRQQFEISLLGQSLRDRQRSQNDNNAEEPNTVSPYREALLGAEK